MCGILGLYNLDGQPVDPDLLRHLRDVMTHRGPDDAGIHIADPTNRWLSRELVPLTRQVLRSRITLERGVFDPRMLRNGLVEQISPWAALNVELWYRIFFDRDREWLDRIGEARAQAEPLSVSA